jgi:hypothetical protein
VGSWLSSRIPIVHALGLLIILVVLMPLLLPRLFDMTLGLSLAARLVITVVTLAPLGFLMGIPFPAGIRWLTSEDGQPEVESGEITPRSDIPWVWAVNGAASVVAPILAALLALAYGFSLVFLAGGLCYGLVLLTVWLSFRRDPARYPAR